MRRALVSSLLVGCVGCGSSQDVVSDPFPIAVDMSNGPVIAHVREGSGADQVAVIDVLAPLTVLDAPAGDPPTRHSADLTLLGDGASGLIPRAHLDLDVTLLHACPDGSPCRVGPDATPIEVGAMIGADAFAPNALRVDYATSQLTLFPDIAGDDDSRGRLCEATFDTPFHGGGTLLLGGTEVSFPARRIAVGACLSYQQAVPPATISADGADVELVVSTGIGPTILDESAYARWRTASGSCADLEKLPTGSVWLPSGLMTGKLGTIDRMALVGGTDADRGPCTMVFAHHLLTVQDCASADSACPCPTGETSCSVPSVLELAPTTPIAVLVVPDDDSTLQALRAEMRPGTPEIDGILGTAALHATSMDVDAPNNRVLFRCAGPGCTARPALGTSDIRPLVEECLARGVADVDGGVPALDASCPTDGAP